GTEPSDAGRGPPGRGKARRARKTAMTRQAHAPRRNGRTVKASLHGLRRILRPSSADQRIGRSRNEKRGAATATRRAPQATTAASTIVSWRPSGSAGNGSEGIAPVDQSVPTSDAAI